MFIQKFFWWCAGSDGEVLRNCPKSDHIKHAGYGMLVLIPALLALISMSYAISTLTPNANKAWGIGIAWAIVVFTFDRFIISTFRKDDSIAKDILSIPFFARLIFAALVGFIIAHPLVMFVFNDSVNSRLDEKQQSEVQSINVSYDNQAAPYADKKSARDLAISKIRTEKDNQIAERESSLIATIGKRKSGRRANEIRKIRERLIRERDANIKTIESEKKAMDDQIALLETSRKKRLKDYQQARDYPAREVALSDLIATNSMIRWTQTLLILLFVFVDILPITFKVTTKKESYDVLLESSHKKAIDASRQEDTLRTELLSATTEHQRRKLAELMEAKRLDPRISEVLNDDIDEILRHRLVYRGAPDVRMKSTDEVTSTTTPSVGAPAKKLEGRKWYKLAKKKAGDKSLDLLISVACIPLQAVVAFGWFMYSGRDVLRYVSFSTLFEAFPLFFVNFFLSGLFKRTTHSSD